MPSSAEQRRQRQQAILQILGEGPVPRQSELVHRLRERGIRATQSSISRDLRQLGIAKLGAGYQPVDEETAGRPRDEEILGGFFVGAATAGPNLVVIRTEEGAAQRIGIYLDRAGWEEIVGTVSGDDTIFVATRDSAGQRRLLARLHRRFTESAGDVFSNQR